MFSDESCLVRTRGCNRLCQRDHYANKRLRHRNRKRRGRLLKTPRGCVLLLLLLLLATRRAGGRGARRTTLNRKVVRQTQHLQPGRLCRLIVARVSLRFINPISRINIGTAHFCKPGTTKGTSHFHFCRAFKRFLHACVAFRHGMCVRNNHLRLNEQPKQH